MYLFNYVYIYVCLARREGAHRRGEQNGRINPSQHTRVVGLVIHNEYIYRYIYVYIYTYIYLFMYVYV